VPIVFVVAAITFAFMHAAPGGPWDRDPGRRQVDPNTQKMLNAKFGLDKEAWLDFGALVRGDVAGFFDTQFITYMIGGKLSGEWTCGFICGNLGPSYTQRGLSIQQILFMPPEDKLFWDSKFGYSIRLGLLSLAVAVVVGLPTGIIAALKQNSIIDYISLFLATAGITIPNFVMGIFMVIIFAVWLHLIPVVPRDWGDIRFWIMPALVLGFGTMAFTARLTRSSMLEVMRQDYVRTARAKGLGERTVVLLHMLKNALIPVLTILGPALVNLITGSFIIETMFAFPGSGRQYVMAISQRDYSMIMATTLIYAILIQLANLSVDFMYTLVDPRIKLS
jgi:oligopeptide transport system permease protein